MRRHIPPGTWWWLRLAAARSRPGGWRSRRPRRTAERKAHAGAPVAGQAGFLRGDPNLVLRLRRKPLADSLLSDKNSLLSRQKFLRSHRDGCALGLVFNRGREAGTTPATTTAMCRVTTNGTAGSAIPHSANTANTATPPLRCLRYLRWPAALKMVSSETTGNPACLSFSPTRRQRIGFGSAACPGTPLG